jgi:hypothetical protein
MTSAVPLLKGFLRTFKKLPVLIRAAILKTQTFAGTIRFLGMTFYADFPR